VAFSVHNEYLLDLYFSAGILFGCVIKEDVSTHVEKKGVKTQVSYENLEDSPVGGAAWNDS
jgi:hypothetical protein